MRFITILIAVALASCQSKEDHGHDHDAEGGHLHDGVETPTVDTTIWTDSIELFVEYPALIVGRTSRFAVHFTRLDKHQPIKDGRVTVSLIQGEKGIRHHVEAPSSPGIFTPALQPKQAGVSQLVFDITTPSFEERIVIKDVPVFSTNEEAEKALGGENGDGGSISFLKEQAWKMEFQTAPVMQREIYEVIPSSGVWQVAPSDYKTLVASTNGTVTFESGNLTEGSRVKKGEVLLTVTSAGLTSNNLGAEIEKANAALQQAKAEYERKSQLYESRIVPKSELEQVERDFLIARSTYETLSEGYSAAGKQVVVPFDGFVKSISVGNGAFVEQGATLLTITSHRSSLLETRVSPAFASQLNHIHDVFYQPKQGDWSSLKKTGGVILSVGKEVESNQPLLSVFSRIKESVQMPEGSFTEVQLAFGGPVKAPVIPESALLEDYGNYSVIVQLSGERFERRPVTIGKRNGSEVEVTEGLTVGEVVVTKGAYQVKMASMAGQAPAHGHAH